MANKKIRFKSFKIPKKYRLLEINTYKDNGLLTFEREQKRRTKRK